jgi:hypothetical protein
MSIKKFFIGMAILLSVSLFVIGCETEVEVPGDTQYKTEGAAGAALEGLQALLDDPKVNPVTYVGVLALTGDQVIVPLEKTLVVTDGVTLDATSAFIVAGTLDLGDSGINVTAGGVVIGGDPTALQEKVTGATVFAIQDGSEAIDLDEGTVAVMGDIAITVAPTSATSINGTALGTKTLYVFGDVTASAVLGAATINVSGSVTVDTAAQVAAVAWNIKGDLTADKVPSVGGAITVGGNATFREAVTTTTGGTLRVDGKATFEKALTVGAALSASGFEAQDAVTLGANLTVNGAAAFSKTAGTALEASAANATVKARAITFSGDVTASKTGSGTIIFDGPVAFGGDLTLTAVPATFKGNVSFAVGKKIVLTTDASIITLGTGVVLGTPTDAGVPAVFGSVISNFDAGAANVTLTPADDTKLTFNAARSVTQESSASSDANHGITIGGKAALPAGATYTVESEENKVGTLTLAASAELSLASGTLLPGPGSNTLEAEAESKLVLTGGAGVTGAKLDGAGKVILGNASITGGASGIWQAVGASTTIALSVTAITGTGTGPVLAALTNDSAVITLGKGTHDDGDGETLTVSNATIDLSTKGAVVFPYVATTPATLVLKGGTSTLGALKLGAGDAGNANENLTAGGHSVAISGADVVVKGATSSADAVAGLISGGAVAIANDATITGQTATNDVTIKAGATLASAES